MRLQSRDDQGLLYLTLSVLFLLLVSTADLVWLGRGEGFTGVASFDGLAAFKLCARALAVGFGLWLFVESGPGPWLWRDPAIRWFALFFLFAAGSAAYAAIPIISATRALSFLGVLFFGAVAVRIERAGGEFRLQKRPDLAPNGFRFRR